MWTCRISNHADFESLMPWACLWLFVYVTMAIVIVYYYGNIWHTFDSLPGILVTNGALQIGTTLIEYANCVFQTWWSKHEASVSSYFCGSAAYNRVGWNLFWRNVFHLMYLRFHEMFIKRDYCRNVSWKLRCHKNTSVCSLRRDFNLWWYGEMCSTD